MVCYFYQHWSKHSYSGYRLLVSPSWETKPLWMGWHDHRVVYPYKREHLSVHLPIQNNNNIIISLTLTFQHKFHYKMHRKRWFRHISFLSDLITCVITEIDSLWFIKLIIPSRPCHWAMAHLNFRYPLQPCILYFISNKFNIMNQFNNKI